MAAVLVKANYFASEGMNSGLHRSASAASASPAPHGAIGSKLGAKTSMSPDSVMTNGHGGGSIPGSFQYPMSSAVQQNSMDGRIAKPRPTAVLMRKLPRNTTHEALRSMLLFAKDLVDVEFVPTEYEDDIDYVTAVAYFQSLNAAKEARTMLDGKPNSTGQANMIVEVTNRTPSAPLGRRNTVDHSSARAISHSVSPTGAMAPLTRASSRFNGTFQSLDKHSPSNGFGGHSDLVTPDGTSNIQGFFSPQSPVGKSINERSRMTGKSVIDEDVDEDTGEILKDPVAFMNNDFSSTSTHAARRPTNGQIPIERFSNLSLSTNVSPPSASSFASPRSAVASSTPATVASSHQFMGSPGYQMNGHQYHRHNYPPVNPADQNPPCNTLYVGNLPIDTSEDELKAMFSKQRGYKRLCFRTKQNGPMCFVEFEDVSFATKALHELYGVTLHNSVKGGIRLSFSKNPLGVRAGQPGSANPTLPLHTQSGMTNASGLTPMSGQGFANANGPPPGLSAPPGLGMPVTSMSVGPPSYSHQINPMMGPMGYANTGLSAGAPGLGGPRGMSTSQAAGMGNSYPDYMLGR